MYLLPTTMDAPAQQALSHVQGETRTTLTELTLGEVATA